MNKSDLLPGPTALELARHLERPAKICLTATGISAASYFLAGATEETIQPWMFPMFAVAVLSFIWGQYRMFAMLFKAIREEKAGYTTTCNLSPKVPQVDYQTGAVLRAVGQPLLKVYTAEQWKGK
ncbi:hypothetical protein JF66_12930 [Cryobacterium sp. MLB-32]|uniref:hypothetical protein n=1 Tax=Cryobacterium sp. MLB-32 TaxID=1529318 RepID=UPI0004E61A28|nr:hypothetical protein [Cryobacterium sp. MLB-32]KFF59211.1 hypothetical protein JF66_12930 [Cryobacterium sp. MLB-32]